MVLFQDIILRKTILKQCCLFIATCVTTANVSHSQLVIAETKFQLRIKKKDSVGNLFI